MSEQFVYKSVFAPYFNSFLDMKRALGFGLLKYKWKFLEFDKFFMDAGVTEPYITREHIAAWRKTCVNDKKKTLYDKICIMNSFCRYLCHLGCECYISPPPRNNSDFTPYIFTHEQIEKIFKICDGLTLHSSNMDCILFALPALFRLLYSTGLRINEALSIKNEDISLDNHWIILKKTKNKVQRLAPINSSLCNVLKQYQEYRNKIPIKGLSTPESHFFISTIGEPLRSGPVYKWFKKILYICEIPHIGNGSGPRVHDLRHTCAVHSLIKLIEDKVDIYCALPIVAAFLGHKDTRSTEQYLRLTNEMYPDIVRMEQSVSSFVFPSKLNLENYYGNN